MAGDTDLAPVGALIGDPGRARVLRALTDGRELPASVLAAEAGGALGAPRVCGAPGGGRGGGALGGGCGARGVGGGGAARHERGRARGDRPSAIGRDLDYRLTDDGARRLRDLGVDVDGALAGPRTPIRYCVD